MFGRTCQARLAASPRETVSRRADLGTISDVLGLTGRAILDALVAGETDPERLADLAHHRIKAPRAKLVECIWAKSMRCADPTRREPRGREEGMALRA